MLQYLTAILLENVFKLKLERWRPFHFFHIIQGKSSSTALWRSEIWGQPEVMTYLPCGKNYDPGLMTYWRKGPLLWTIISSTLLYATKEGIISPPRNIIGYISPLAINKMTFSMDIDWVNNWYLYQFNVKQTWLITNTMCTYQYVLLDLIV